MFKTFKVVLDGNYIYAVDEVPLKTKSGEELLRVRGHLPLSDAPFLDDLILLPSGILDWMHEGNIPKYYIYTDSQPDNGIYSNTPPPTVMPVGSSPGSICIGSGHKAIGIMTNSIYVSL